jgi:hypothetical protein
MSYISEAKKDVYSGTNKQEKKRMQRKGVQEMWVIVRCAYNYDAQVMRNLLQLS